MVHRSSGTLRYSFATHQIPCLRRNAEGTLRRARDDRRLKPMTTATAILKRHLGRTHPLFAMVLGSSLGGLADELESPRTLSYDELPGFPVPSVSGHAGELVSGVLAGHPVMMLKGRAHAYETGNAGAMRPVIEALAGAGVTRLVLTNAAGSLRPEVGPGRIMLITDHINLAGMSPLAGEAGDERFVSLTNAYDIALTHTFRAGAKAENIALAEGVYAWFSGPMFETPAEIKMAAILGAHAVGMSTAPETIIARRFGLKVAALSVITNLGAGIGDASPSHEETKREGAKATADMARLIARFTKDIADA
jgi:purine-nucleoside phosphorylase